MTDFRINNLKVWFPAQENFFRNLSSSENRYVKAVDGVSFSIRSGEIFCLVGESGCGKTTTGNAILRLEEPTSGQVIYNDVDLLSLSRKEFTRYRSTFQKIFQDPFGSLNPRQKILDIISEPLLVHRLAISPQDRKERVLKALEDAGLTPPDAFLHYYPHQISGGQRQRVVIASALALDPKFIVADEPVSMLDVSIRANILKLLIDLRDKKHLTFLFITHDLSLAWAICDRIAVMYLGKIIEIGSADTIIHEPKHPYTRALSSVIPIPDPASRKDKIILEGDIPNPINIPSGCRFHPRCNQKRAQCAYDSPELQECGSEHWVACPYAA